MIFFAALTTRYTIKEEGDAPVGDMASEYLGCSGTWDAIEPTLWKYSGTSPFVDLGLHIQNAHFRLLLEHKKYSHKNGLHAFSLSERKETGYAHIFDAPVSAFNRIDKKLLITGYSVWRSE